MGVLTDRPAKSLIDWHKPVDIFFWWVLPHSVVRSKKSENLGQSQADFFLQDLVFQALFDFAFAKELSRSLTSVADDGKHILVAGAGGRVDMPIPSLYMDGKFGGDSFQSFGYPGETCAGFGLGDRITVNCFGHDPVFSVQIPRRQQLGC